MLKKKSGELEEIDPFGKLWINRIGKGLYLAKYKPLFYANL